MTRLEEIKDTVARVHGKPNWKELLYWGSSSSGFDYDNAIDDVVIEYAEECAQQSLSRASMSAKLYVGDNGQLAAVDKESITDYKNIVLP